MVMVYIVLAYVVMAYISMAYIGMAQFSYGLYSYGLYRCGLYSVGSDTRLSGHLLLRRSVVPSLTSTSSAASKKFKLALSGHACARARARTHPRMHTRKDKAAGHKAAAEKAAAEKVFYDNAMVFVVSRSQYVTEPACTEVRFFWAATEVSYGIITSTV